MPCDINPRRDSNTVRNMEMRIKAVYTLWAEWLYSFGSLTIAVILSFVISKTILPAVVLTMAFVLNRYLVPMRERRVLACVRITSLTARALVISALIMIVCLVVNKTMLLSWLFPQESLNPEIPYVTALIVFPVTAIVFGYGFLTHGRSRHCRECKMRLGYSPEDNFAGNVFHNEATRQLKLMFWLCTVLAVVNWIYYFLKYSNASINGADKYFFLFAPVCLFIFSLFYTGSRYKSVVEAFRHSMCHSEASVTTLRFLILRGDELLLETVEPEDMDDYSRADTPAVVEIPYQHDVSEGLAKEEFSKISGMEADDFKIKPLFSNLTQDFSANVFHYAVVLDENKPLPQTWRFTGIWTTLDQIDRLMKSNAVTRSLSTEIYRIYVITMAWKTYDDRGFRRYPVKNYHPTFRLRDFRDWDVDYSDNRWLSISEYNQDRSLFRVRRFLRQLGGKSMC